MIFPQGPKKKILFFWIGTRSRKGDVLISRRRGRVVECLVLMKLFKVRGADTGLQPAQTAHPANPAQRKIKKMRQAKGQ